MINFEKLISFLRIDRSDSICFFKITIFRISFSNAKWIFISLESLMIELYLHLKFNWITFQEGWNMPNLDHQRLLYFEFQYQKLLRLYHNTYILILCINLSTKLYQGLWFNWTHLPLIQNISVKIYTNFCLFSGGYNFKINYLKDTERGFISCWTIWCHPHCKTSITFGTGGQNAMKTAVKFYPEIFEFIEVKQQLDRQMSWYISHKELLKVSMRC